MILVTGGARSGKSRFARELVGEGRVIFVATASIRDEEMRLRIEAHRRERPSHWETVEEERDLIGALSPLRGDEVVLVDCITLWLSNLMEAGLTDQEIEGEADRLREYLLRFPRVVVVTNEVGWGVVPANPLARRFRDMAGRVNQIFASAADEVYLMVAGLPLKVKG